VNIISTEKDHILEYVAFCGKKNRDCAVCFIVAKYRKWVLWPQLYVFCLCGMPDCWKLIFKTDHSCGGGSVHPYLCVRCCQLLSLSVGLSYCYWSDRIVAVLTMSGVECCCYVCGFYLSASPDWISEKCSVRYFAGCSVIAQLFWGRGKTDRQTGAVKTTNTMHRLYHSFIQYTGSCMFRQ
jgi:hypothetical protein